MKNNHIQESLRQRKALLQAKLAQTQALIRGDVKDLKEDLHPFSNASHFIKNMLNPSTETQLTDNSMLNFGVDTGISMLVNRFVPGGHIKAVRVLAPVLIKNLASHVLPQAKETAGRFLHWVADKTAEKPDKKALNGKIKAESTAISG